MIGMIKNVPYMYVELPNIDIMIIFSSVSIPSSLKFIIGNCYDIQDLFYKNLHWLPMEKGRPG